MLRVIREVRPRWVVGENVYGIVNWSGGLVFDEVQSDLEAAGYEVQAYVLPAASVGAPHRRDRVWFVANAGSLQLQGRMHEAERKSANGYFSAFYPRGDKSKSWHDFPTQSPICGRDDGLPFGLDNITFSKWRIESIKGFGNAIVPQVAYQIFKAINEYEHRNI